MHRSRPERIGDVLTPFRIALVYVVVGGAWIAFSDRLLLLLVADPAVYAELQTAKGWVYVLASGLLLYALVASRERRLAEAGERTERALKQATVLHRVLRHNLRNVCNVIQGHTELLATTGGGEVEAECVEAVTTETDRLVALGEKTRVLQDVLRTAGTRREIDVAEVLRGAIADLRQRHPDVTVEADLPEAATVRADEHLQVAVAEVFENAVMHHDAEAPRLRVALTRLSEGRVRVDVADDGPGIPQMERDVLEAGVERPMFHSQGLGLWLVHTVVQASGGEVSIVDNEPRGSVVRFTLGGDGQV